MKQMTDRFLREAFAGESQAHMKYKNFAKVAAKEGKKNVARLFEAISFAEQVHASSHLQVLGDVKGTADNLQAAFNGETFEIDEMYPAYMATGELQHEKQAVASMKRAEAAERDHQKLYKEAKEAVDAGKDMSDAKIHVCEICGHTHVGEHAPDKCPLCGAGKDKFKAF